MDELEKKIKGADIGSEHKLSQRMWEKTTDPFAVHKKTPEETAYWEKISQLQSSDGITDEKKFDRFINCYASVLGVPHKMDMAHFVEVTQSDKDLLSLIHNLSKWFYKKDSKGGLIISSAPGVGKTNIVKALSMMSTFYGNKDNAGKFEYYDMNFLISDFLNGLKPDLTFYKQENLIIDDLSERINGVSAYGFKFSLDLIFENRYNIWKSTGHLSIITTNIFPYSTDGMVTLEDLLTERSLDRIKEQYHIVILSGESKRI